MLGINWQKYIFAQKFDYFNNYIIELKYMNKKTNKQKVRRKSTIKRHNVIHKEYEKLKSEIGADVFSGLSKNYICKEISKRLLLHEKSIQQIINSTEYDPDVG